MKLRFAARRVDIIVSLPSVTLSKAKSARRGELISRVKICTAIKLRLVEANLVCYLKNDSYLVFNIFYEVTYRSI